MKNTIAFDIEIYHGFAFIGMKCIAGEHAGKRLAFEYSSRKDFDRARVRKILRRNRMVGFNSNNYDLPIIHLMLKGADHETLKQASDNIIMGGMKSWEFYRHYEIEPLKLDHIDLIEPNPAVNTGLKALNGRLHGRRLQDLPIDPHATPTEAEMDQLIDYCLISDLDATHLLWDSMQEQITLREAMGAIYKQDFRSKSDAQMGEAIVKSTVEQIKGTRLSKPTFNAGFSFKYNIPEFISFRTKQLRDVLETIRNTNFVLGRSAKIDLPKSITELKLKIGETEYQMGIGGLHSTEKCRVVRSSDTHVLLDGDCASQYPSIIMKLGLFPKAMGKDFLGVYKSLLDKRLAAKRSGDKITNLGLKISINGIYGKLGSPYSTLYAPHLMVSVTLTGQLTLLMLIERLESVGVKVMSGNTDGIVFLCPREMFNGFVMEAGKPTARLNPSPLQDVVEWWEKTTSFDLEFGEFDAVYSRDVNCYLALKPGGKAKRKGFIANHWEQGSPDFDPTSQMKKNPEMTVVGDACLAFLRDGTRPEEFIHRYTDVRGFIGLTRVTGGATWRGEYLGKVVRFYWSTDGDPILRKTPNKQGTHARVAKTEGAKPLMTMDGTLPDDIDYQHYVDHAWDVIRSLGWKPTSSKSAIEQIYMRVLGRG